MRKQKPIYYYDVVEGEHTQHKSLFTTVELRLPAQSKRHLVIMLKAWYKVPSEIQLYKIVRYVKELELVRRDGINRYQFKPTRTIDINEILDHEQN